jgi:hypothetical protein
VVGSSPAATPSSASSAPCWPSRTTLGRSRRHMGLEILAACRKLTSHPETAESGVAIEPISA